jgi:hypothetical protein
MSNVSSISADARLVYLVNVLYLLHHLFQSSQLLVAILQTKAVKAHMSQVIFQ